MKHEPGESMGLGKKIESRPIITPDWRPVPGKKDLWVNKAGQLKSGRLKTPAEEFFEAFTRNLPHG